MAPSVKHEPHQITCPYCLEGYGVVTVERSSSGPVTIQLNDLLRCGSCGQYFKIKPVVTLKGVILDQKDLPPQVRLN